MMNKTILHLVFFCTGLLYLQALQARTMPVDGQHHLADIAQLGADESVCYIGLPVGDTGLRFSCLFFSFFENEEDSDEDSSNTKSLKHKPSPEGNVSLPALVLQPVNYAQTNQIPVLFGPVSGKVAALYILLCVLRL